MRVGVLGRTEMLLNTIAPMSEAGHEIVFIITSSASSHYTKDESDYENFAQMFSIPYLLTESVNSPEVISWVNQHHPDIGISVNWKTIIKQEVIDSFKYGIINAHAGDLPLYRGNATPNWAIITGGKNIVLTLCLMNEELDAGPILMKRSLQIDENTRVGHIYDFMNSNIPEMFVKAVAGLEDKTIKPEIQPDDPSQVLRCLPRMGRDSEIHWQDSAVRIDRLIRASSEPFAGAYTFLGLKKVVIWRARCEKSKISLLGTPGQVAEIRPRRGEIVVVTGDGLLVIEEIEVEGIGREKASEIIKRVRTRFGIDISREIMQLNANIIELKNLMKKLEKEINVK